MLSEFCFSNSLHAGNTSNKTPQARSRSRCSSNSSSISNLGLHHQQAAASTNITPSRNHNYQKGKVTAGDRYVCVRNDEQMEFANHLLTQEDKENQRELCNTSSSAPTSPASRLERDTKKSMMRVRSDGMLEERVCAFRKGLAPVAAFGHRQPVNVLYSLKPSSSVKRSRRYIAKSPERILDAPGIRDDYYATLTDWSKTNIVAVALGNAIYLWHAERGDVEVLVDFGDDATAFPTLVRWSHEGKFLSVGTSDGQLRIYDAGRRTCLRTLSVQMHRMACGCWSRRGLVSYGTRSGRIYHHDVRVQQSLVSVFDSHSAEVCGMKWSDDEHYLTSGGAGLCPSDALVNVWEQSQLSADEPQPLHTFNEHVASVKAVEYVPSFIGSAMVATGGGTHDQTVRIWNLVSGTQHSVQNTNSQVTGILFNRHFKEMIVGNGNPNSGVRLWKYEPTLHSSFEHVADLKSHGGRVLGLCQSPCGQYVMSTGEDETMRLWHCWKQDASTQAAGSKSATGYTDENSKQAAAAASASAKKKGGLEFGHGGLSGRVIR